MGKEHRVLGFWRNISSPFIHTHKNHILNFTCPKMKILQIGSKIWVLKLWTLERTNLFCFSIFLTRLSRNEIFVNWHQKNLSSQIVNIRANQHNLCHHMHTNIYRHQLPFKAQQNTKAQSTQNSSMGNQPDEIAKQIQTIVHVELGFEPQKKEKRYPNDLTWISCLVCVLVVCWVDA